MRKSNMHAMQTRCMLLGRRGHRQSEKHGAANIYTSAEQKGQDQEANLHEAPTETPDQCQHN